MPDRSEIIAEIERFVKESLNVTAEGAVPKDIHDLDSFSVVRLLLHLERTFDLTVLEELPNFQGVKFDELADFMLSVAADTTASS